MGGRTCKKSRKVSNAWYSQLESPFSEILFKGVQFHEVYNVYTMLLKKKKTVPSTLLWPPLKKN